MKDMETLKNGDTKRKTETMKTAEQMKTVLSRGKPPSWVHALVLQRYPSPYGKRKSTQASFFREVTVRIPTDETTRWGKPKPQRRRIDLVTVIFPHIKQWVPLICGIEIKVTHYDLMNDTKIGDYLGFCDLFFLAVPKVLGDKALKKVKAVDNRVGVLVVSNQGINRVTINRYPNDLEPSLANKIKLRDELLVKPLRD